VLPTDKSEHALVVKPSLYAEKSRSLDFGFGLIAYCLPRQVCTLFSLRKTFFQPMCQLQGFQSCGSHPGGSAPAAGAYASLGIPAYVLSRLCTCYIIKHALALLPAPATTVAELAMPCVLQLDEDPSVKNVTKETDFQRLHLINWDTSWPHSSLVLAEALPYGCRWPSNTGAAAGGFPLRLLKVSSTWGLLDRPNHTEPGDPSSASLPSPVVTQAPLLRTDSLPALTYRLPFQYYHFT